MGEPGRLPAQREDVDLDKTVDLPIGKTASITFDEPGTYLYQCSLHPDQMKGKVVVET
ncbi:MAG: cupredoxin domain-containing protein [Actinomycetota bacterium]|nr:cupredoxin domain-containing protein [Actinomycetota bacterium]